MRDLIDRWRDAALSEFSHQGMTVGAHPVAWWFNSVNATTEDFMRALAADAELVVPGEPAASRFLTVYLRPTRPMGRTLQAERATVEKWIFEGAHVPGGTESPQGGKPARPFARAGLSSRQAAPPLFSPEMSPDQVRVNEPEYFHRLINIEDYPAFLPMARQLARFYLDRGLENEAKQSPDSLLKWFPYDPTGLDKRLQRIYDEYAAAMYKPHWFDTGILEFPDDKGNSRAFAIGRVSDKVPRERLFQMAPFNLADGAWLQNVLTVGPSSTVQSHLFAIWNDEAGNGVVSQNHSNVYDALLKSINVYLPPITSREFLRQSFLPGAFSGAVFQLSVGQFPQDFFPELLGMTLYLEWEATPTLTPFVRMLAGRGINPHFYRLHVAIDNISEGHGALAKEAVKLYLAEKQEEGGLPALEQHWKRIWNGYVTWATISSFGKDLTERFLVMERKQINISTDPSKRECWPDFGDYARRQMLSLVERKAAVARQVHGGRSLGGESLAALFDDPPRLLDALVRWGYVEPERPRDSKLLELMEFNGPMYKVFTEGDKDVILDWIESLRPSSSQCIDRQPDLPPPTELPAKVARLIAEKADSAATFHDGITLMNPAGQAVFIKELFRKPAELMRALRDCGWVVPTEWDRSMFVTRLLTNNGPMANVFSSAEVETIKTWIRQGAQLPAAVEPSDAAALAELAPAPTRASWATRRQFVGIGAVH